MVANLASEDRGYAALGKNGMYDGLMDVWGESQEQNNK